MFKLNNRLQVKQETLQESVIYYIDNFYLHPKEVEEYLFDKDTPLHKIEQKPSYNNIHFEDRRLIKEDERLHTVVNFISQICNQKPETYAIVTNMQRFFNHDFNDYKNCVWWPHQDNGYNGIVYFSDECGTNLYSTDTTDELPNAPEHYKPWRLRENYKILKTLKPKYNRLVLFDGFKFPHGVDICSHRYYGEEYRKNQVFFFQNYK
tara:strand:- start:181 stop:801 length:621 start_codon:yes stop_codon:yes gene_type:complete